MTMYACLQVSFEGECVIFFVLVCISSYIVTQPLLLTANYALWKLSNIKPDDINIMAGHSLGEYSAYLAADSINFEDTLQLVSLRAEFMQEAVKEGEGGNSSDYWLIDR